MTTDRICKKLHKIIGKELTPLEFTPFPGEFGKVIQQDISKEAWDLWLAHQTILINEYRLSSIDPKAREFLREQMKQFLFENVDLEKPESYTEA